MSCAGALRQIEHELGAEMQRTGRIRLRQFEAVPRRWRRVPSTLRPAPWFEPKRSTSSSANG